MGWNIWDRYGTTVTEDEVLANANFIPRLQSGRPLILNGHGRRLATPKRFPSAAGGAGFAPLADRVHQLGLCIGPHIMRGIPRHAVAARLPVADTDFTADEIADTDSVRGVDFIRAEDMLFPYHEQ